jgi:endonuclease/exonuclease/phosphatase family metal-dependent hydrolase
MSQYKPAGENHKKRGRVRRIVRRAAIWINILAAAALLLSYLAPYVDPQNFWPLAFIGLAYSYLLIINLIFVLLWLVLWKKLIFLSLASVILGWGNLALLFQISGKDADTSPGSIKIVSFNVRVFDLYNWSQNKNTRNRIFNFLRAQKADVICLQEFYDNPVQFPVLDTLKQLLGMEQSAIGYTLEKGSQHFGIATFSRFPIVGKGFVDFGEKSNNSFLYADLLLEKDTVRIYNTHLQSNRFNDADYKFLEKLGSDAEIDEIKGSRKILRKLKYAFIKRGEQVGIVREHIMQCRYPLVLCGDFNDSPFSYTYETLSEDMKDAFVESGTGFGKTYNGKIPSFRIDYILTSEKWEVSGFETLPENLSDHYPVTCRVRLAH